MAGRPRAGRRPPAGPGRPDTLNFAAHIVVAAELVERPTTPYLLGAAAPDLARMARVPVTTEGPEDLLAGVAAHHRTDAAFHDGAWFRSRNRALVRTLADLGVRRGPARGAGHVLVELLLDGALLAETGHASTFARAWAALGHPTADAVAIVPPAHRDRWVDLLDQLTTRLDPTAYLDPDYAADRTAGTLARRPRLAMDEAEREALRGAAAELQPAIRAEAPDVLAEVVAALT
ncbi:MAG TPA: hypothetical protein VD926_09620 [Acidimicrobiales bacterium]|nr:hypothetical protein [Acidimicrobiales bacterium]